MWKSTQYLAIMKINNQIWVNALTADESITMEEIHARHPSLVDSVAFIDVSNLEAKHQQHCFTWLGYVILG